MTIRDFWELNIRGNANQYLKGLSTAGVKASSSFTKARTSLAALAPTGAKSIGMLETQLKKLEIRQRQAFDPRHIKRYNIMIDQTRAKIMKLEALGRRRSAMSMGGFGRMGMGMGMNPLSLLMPFGVAGGLAMGGFSAMSNTIMPFSKEMSRVQAITGASAADRALLEGRAMDVAAGTPFTPTEAAMGERYMGMAGWNKSQIMMGLPSVANLSMAGDVDMGRSADILSNIMGQHGLGASRTADTANTLSALISTSNTNLEQAAEAYKYLGPSLSAFNVTLQDTGTIIALLADQGVQGSLAGRALGTSLTRLAKPTDKMEESMDALGIKAFDATGKFVGMKNLIAQLEEGTKRLTDEQRAAHLQTIFGAEAYQEINILLSQGSEEFGRYSESLNAQGKTAEMARIQTDNLTGDIDKMNSAWERLILTMDNGEGALSRFLRSMTQGTASMLNTASVNEKFGMGFMGISTGPLNQFMVDEYKRLDEKLFNATTMGGSAEEQTARLGKLKSQVISGFAFGSPGDSFHGSKVQTWHSERRMKMQSDLLQRITQMINSLENDEAIKPNKSEDGSVSTTHSAVDSINSGGRRVRNVIVNIDKLVETMVNNVGSLQAGDTKAVEDDAVGLLLRVINGAEMASVNGEY